MAGVIGVASPTKNGLLSNYRSSSVFANLQGKVLTIESETIYQSDSFLIGTYVNGVQDFRTVFIDYYNKKYSVVRQSSTNDTFKFHIKGKTLYISGLNDGRVTITRLYAGNAGSPTFNSISESDFKAIGDLVEIPQTIDNFGYNTLDELAAALKPKLGLS